MYILFIQTKNVGLQPKFTCVDVFRPFSSSILNLCKGIASQSGYIKNLNIEP